PSDTLFPYTTLFRSECFIQMMALRQWRFQLKWPCNIGTTKVKKREQSLVRLKMATMVIRLVQCHWDMFNHFSQNTNQCCLKFFELLIQIVTESLMGFPMKSTRIFVLRE